MNLSNWEGFPEVSGPHLVEYCSLSTCTLRFVEDFVFCLWSELDVILDWRQGLLTRRKLFRISANI